MYAGLDLSLTETGVAILSSQGELIHKEVIKGDKIKGADRLCMIRDRIVALLLQFEVKAIAIEGYSMGSRGRLFDIGELGGVIRVALRDRLYSWSVIPPTSLKAFITGTGNADKQMMIASVEKYFGLTIKNNNEADAYSLAKMLQVLGPESVMKYCQKGGADLLRKDREAGRIPGYAPVRQS